MNNFPQLIGNRGWNGLPSMSKALYKETYFQPGEKYDQWLYRVTEPYQNDPNHGDRVRTYIRNYWYHPSTPISSGKGLPISCYTSHIGDNNKSIFDGYHEGMWLGAQGGGRGVYWGDVGGAGRPINLSKELIESLTWSEIQASDDIMKSSGVIPFLGTSDRYTYSISQAGTRRATEAAYLPINHPDIEDFIDIRLETGDPNRRMSNLHHGIAITDDFMRAVENLDTWDLICPHTGKVTSTVDAYDLWIDILLCRKTETGEPFLLFIDTVNRTAPKEYHLAGMKVVTSNICTEITLYTDENTTAVCNLGSTNLEYWDEYKDDIQQVIADLTDFHDNVNTVFLEMTDKFTGSKRKAFEKARNAVINERNIGIGVMGFHSYLQRKMIPFESPMAKATNKTIFKAIREAGDLHQEFIAANFPEQICPLSKKVGTKRRNIHLFAIAPTMSISNLCNLTSSGIEPWVSNAFSKKLFQGTFSIRNKYLEGVIAKYVAENNLDFNWVDAQWSSIIKHGGSVQHLEWMEDYVKDVFKTAFELDQRSIIGLAADRTLYIDQSQSLNIFLPAECSYEELHTIHFMAWQLGIKSLYYLRSEPETTAQTGTRERKEITLEDDICVSCT